MGQVGVGADHHQLVERVEPLVAAGDVDALLAAQDGDHVDVALLAEVELLEALAHAGRVLLHLEVGQVEVALKQVVGEALVDGGLPLLFLLAGAEVAEEAPLDEDGVLLEPLGGDHEQDEDAADGQGEARRRAHQAGHGDHQDEGREHDAHHDERDERAAVELVVAPELLELLGVVLLHHDGPQQGGDEEQAEAQREQVALDAGGVGLDERMGHLQHQEDDDQRDGRVGGDDAQQGFQQAAPGALLADGGRAGGVFGQPLPPLLGDEAVEQAVGGIGHADHVGGEEGGDDRDGHHDGVEERVGHLQRQSQPGDDEGELADLRQGEARLNGHPQRLPREEHAQCGEAHLARHHRPGDDEDRHLILPQHGGVDQHADRDEEDGPEEVFHRLDQPLDALGLDRLGQDGAHHEGAQGGREAGLRGDQHHAQAKPHADDQQRLAAQEALGLLQERGDQVDAHHEAEEQEHAQLHHAAQQLHALDRLAHGHGGEQYHQQDGEEILDHEDAEHDAREMLVAQAHVVEGLEDDGGRRHREHAAQEEAVHLPPAQGETRGVAERHHAHHHRDGADDGRAAHLHQLLEAEVEPQGEEQEDHADVGPGVDALHVGHRRDLLHGGAGQDAGHDVAQHDGLLQLLEQQGEHPGGYEDDRQIDDERCYL